MAYPADGVTATIILNLFNAETRLGWALDGAVETGADNVSFFAIANEAVRRVCLDTACLEKRATISLTIETKTHTLPADWLGGGYITKTDGNLVGPEGYHIDPGDSIIYFHQFLVGNKTYYFHYPTVAVRMTYDSLNVGLRWNVLGLVVTEMVRLWQRGAHPDRVAATEEQYGTELMAYHARHGAGNVIKA